MRVIEIDTSWWPPLPAELADGHDGQRDHRSDYESWKLADNERHEQRNRQPTKSVGQRSGPSLLGLFGQTLKQNTDRSATKLGGHQCGRQRMKWRSKLGRERLQSIGQQLASALAGYDRSERISGGGRALLGDQRNRFCDGATSAEDDGNKVDYRSNAGSHSSPTLLGAPPSQVLSQTPQAAGGQAHDY